MPIHTGSSRLAMLVAITLMMMTIMIMIMGVLVDASYSSSSATNPKNKKVVLNITSNQDNDAATLTGYNCPADGGGGTNCTSGQSCCGADGMDPSCYDPRHNQCCYWGGLSSVVCGAKDSCCGSGGQAESNAFCCPQHSVCCGSVDDEYSLCCNSSQICCGGDGNSPTCCDAASEICSNRQCVPATPIPSFSPNGGGGSVAWEALTYNSGTDSLTPLPRAAAGTGRVFYATAKGVSCTDVAHGSLLWTWTCPDGGGGASLLVNNESDGNGGNTTTVVIIYTSSTFTYRLSPESGAVVWYRHNMNILLSGQHYLLAGHTTKNKAGQIVILPAVLSSHNGSIVPLIRVSEFVASGDYSISAYWASFASTGSSGNGNLLPAVVLSLVTASAQHVVLVKFECVPTASASSSSMTGRVPCGSFKQAWSTAYLSLSWSSWSTLRSVNGGTHYCFTDKKVHLINADTGKQEWTSDHLTGVVVSSQSSPILYYDFIHMKQNDTRVDGTIVIFVDALKNSIVAVNLLGGNGGSSSQPSIAWNLTSPCNSSYCLSPPLLFRVVTLPHPSSSSSYSHMPVLIAFDGTGEAPGGDPGPTSNLLGVHPESGFIFFNHSAAPTPQGFEGVFDWFTMFFTSSSERTTTTTNSHQRLLFGYPGASSSSSSKNADSGVVMLDLSLYTFKHLWTKNMNGQFFYGVTSDDTGTLFVNVPNYLYAIRAT